jgi:nucleoside-diphosphate-sugar epimerase
MRVFVTGASGFIGTAVIAELIGAGHRVVGLARSPESAAKVEATGAAVHRGSLEDLDSLRAGAAGSDGVVHLAFDHDFSSSRERAAAADARAIAAMGDALAGSNRPIVIASGLGIAAGRVSTEADRAPPGWPRRASEEVVFALAEREVRSAIVRLPPTVHGRGDRGFVPWMIAAARRHGHAGYVGNGANRWPAVHRFDAARLFRLAVERAPAGSILHAVADEGVRVRDIAAVIAQRLGVGSVVKSADEAGEYFGFLAALVGLDIPASSVSTRERFGWTPVEPGLLADLDDEHYFATADAVAHS